MISQDLDELLAITDRLAVLHLGRLSEAMVTAEVTAEQIGLLMGGTNVASGTSVVGGAAGAPAGVDVERSEPTGL